MTSTISLTEQASRGLIGVSALTPYKIAELYAPDDPQLRTRITERLTLACAMRELEAEPQATVITRQEVVYPNGLYGSGPFYQDVRESQITGWLIGPEVFRRIPESLAKDLPELSDDHVLRFWAWSLVREKKAKERAAATPSVVPTPKRSKEVAQTKVSEPFWD